MSQQTAVEWLEQQIKDIYDKEGKLPLAYTLDLVRQAKVIEEQRLKDAIMYALDEDGHTGEWKIKFANDYINNSKQTK